MQYKLKRGVKRFLRFSGVCLLVISYFALLTNVIAETNKGSGEYCFTFDMDSNGFPVSSVTINGEEWVKNEDIIFHNNEDTFTIVVKVGKNAEDKYPWISTAGGLDNYKTYTALPNPEQSDEVEGDEYILTLVMHNLPKQNNAQCESMGISLQEGPFPVYPEIDATANVSITISGDELEYHYDEQHLDEADVAYFKFDINGGSDSDHLVPFTFRNAEYTYNDNEAPHNVSSVTTKQPIEYHYTYNGTGYVEFCVNGGSTDEYTHIYINGVDYANQAPHTQVQHMESLNGWAQMFCIENVPYNTTEYNVVVEGENTALENRVPGFGWSYLSADRSEGLPVEEEGNFAHGRLEFVSASVTIDNELLEFNSVNAFNNYRYHNKGQIFQFNQGEKNYPEEERWRAWGSAQLPYGTTLTVRIVPDEGYQLTSLASSPNGFQATDEPGVYTLVLNNANFAYNNDEDVFNLQPVFTEVGATVVAAADSVTSGTIQLGGGENSFAAGTPKLQVEDAENISEERIADFTDAAEDEGYTISNYLDISLFNSIYKGGKKDANNNFLSWDTAVNNLTNLATISLKLDNALDGTDVAVVHEAHEGENIVSYDVIEGTYDVDTQTITFETDAFSTYAIIYKGENPNNNNENNNEDNNENNNENPNQQEVTHHIDFDSIGGSPVSPADVVEGQALERPEDPTLDKWSFEGWYEDDEYNTPFDFSTPITREYTLFAKWERLKDTNYQASDDNNNSISFKEQEGHTYEFTIINYLDYTKEQILAANPDITEEVYDAMLETLQEITKAEGTLIGLYEITLTEDGIRDLHEGPFTVRIKATEEMKKYNTIKMIFVADDNSTEAPIPFTLEGDYYVGTLNHLSTYTLVGSNTSVSGNPDTHDSIYLWLAMLVISGLGMAITTVLTNKAIKAN